MVNAEHYADPTAELAIARADRELRLKRKLAQENEKRKKYRVKKYAKPKK